MIAALCKIPPRDLDETRRGALKQLACHYLSELSERLHKKRKAGNNHSNGSSRGRKTAKKGGKGPFAIILNLPPLHLHPAVEAHLQRYEADAYAFLHTKELTNTAGHHSADSSGEAFILQYSYTKSLDSQIGISRIQWLFMMLMWHDVVKLARPDCTGTRIGRLMQEHLCELIAPVYSASKDMKTVSMEDVASELKLWCKLGNKINIFVTQFGAGCLFFLDNGLTRNL